MTPYWWARGLTLAERLELPADESQPPPGHRRPLDLWRDTYGSAARADARLAELGLNPSQLLNLYAEPPAALAARATTPRWAVVVEEALAEAPAGSHLGDEIGWADGFAAILAPFTSWAAAELRRAPLADMDLEAVTSEFTVQLSRRLTRIAARCLVLELNIARVAGRLRGGTPTRRFTEFVERTATPAGITALLTEYPVLARLLARTCEQAVDTLTELLGRWASDRSAVQTQLLGGAPTGSLVSVRTRAGDGHCGGRSVAVLRFASGVRVVYKPRPVTAHRQFNALLGWLNERLPQPSLRPVALVERPGYGWAEYVEPGPCRTEPDIQQFYQRQGVLLALLYALDATDVHYENLLARADQPVLVDVETLFHPAVPPHGSAEADPAATGLRSSVHRVALLPRMLVTGTGAIDVSGLGGDHGSVSPFETIDWDAAGTDTMRLVRGSRVFRGAANQPTLDGRPTRPDAYVGELLAGFRLGYDAIVAGRDDLLGPRGILRGFANAEVRVVARATRWYARLLDESTHPDVMRDALDRDRLFEQLWATGSADPIRSGLVRDEVDQLWDGDVPLFRTEPGASQVWGRAESPVARLVETGLDRVEHKIRRLDRTDRNAQEWIIRAAFLSRTAHPEHQVDHQPPTRAGSTCYDSDLALTIARRVADQLAGTAYHGGGRVNWLGFEPLEAGHWDVLPLGAGLASGYCGPALFLAQLAVVTGTDRYADLAEHAMAGLLPLLDGVCAEPRYAEIIGPGGFAGFGGIAYALAELSGLLADPGLLTGVEQAIALTASTAQSTVDPGVFGGVAGGLAAMVAVHQATGLASAWDTAVSCAERLLALPPPAESSFAHGERGVGWALLKFAGAGGGPRSAAVGSQALATATPPMDLSVCHGWAGVGIAAVEVMRSGHAPGVADHAIPAVAAVTAGDLLANHSLCHGELGVLEFLAAAAAAGYRRAAIAHPRRAGLTLAALDRSGPRCGTPAGITNPGLLAGLAGIGHGVLRLGSADQIGSALLLEPTRRWHPPEPPAARRRAAEARSTQPTAGGKHAQR